MGSSPGRPVLPLRHRRATVRSTQMRFARVLAWITHASAGNQDPHAPLPPRVLGPEPFSLSNFKHLVWRRPPDGYLAQAC